MFPSPFACSCALYVETADNGLIDRFLPDRSALLCFFALISERGFCAVISLNAAEPGVVYEVYYFRFGVKLALFFEI